MQMKCPFCLSKNVSVLETREAESSIRRRRLCKKCNKRFTTHERVETDLIVIKKDGRRELFDREKLKVGMLKACEKRSIGINTINKMLDKVEQELRKLNTSEIKSKVIGNKVISKLKNLDEVAYLRFASVYKEFDNVKKFKEEIKRL